MPPTIVNTTLSRAFLRSPSRAAVTADPMVALELMRMKVMSAMNGMLKTSGRFGQGAALDWRRKAYPQRRPEKSKASVTMKIHIIVFCQLAPKGAAPPPQCASIVVA